MTVGEAVLLLNSVVCALPGTDPVVCVHLEEDLRHNRVAAGLARDLFNCCVPPSSW